MWADTMEAVVSTLRADATLSAIPGFMVLRQGEFTQPHVPSVAWMVYTDPEAENTDPIFVQIDVFADGLTQAVTIERRLRALLHSDTPQTLAGVRMWTLRLDARDHADPEPGRVHRSLDFQFEPAREG